MKAITLWQPQASWIALNWKTIETRTHERFKSLEGQRIAIHAAKKVDESEIANRFLPPMDGLGVQNYLTFINICRGKIVCTARVVECRWAPNVGFDLREEWNRKAMCEVAGKYLLFLDEIEPVSRMIPFRGRPGIFNVSDELVESQQ